MAGDEQLGILCCIAHEREFGPDDTELLGAVAHQTSVGLKKAELIERLTAENTVKDMFDALAAGSVEAAEAKAIEAGCDLGQPHLFLHVERASEAPEGSPVFSELAPTMEAQLRRLGPRALFDSRPDRLRGLVPLPTGKEDGVERLRAACEPLGRDQRLVIGLSEADCGAATPPHARGGRRRAHRQLARRRGRRRLAEQLGAYRYLVHLELDDAPATATASRSRS